jgi:hypothetical protein
MKDIFLAIFLPLVLFFIWGWIFSLFPKTKTGSIVKWAFAGIIVFSFWKEMLAQGPELIIPLVFTITIVLSLLLFNTFKKWYDNLIWCLVNKHVNKNLPKQQIQKVDPKVSLQKFWEGLSLLKRRQSDLGILVDRNYEKRITDYFIEKLLYWGSTEETRTQDKVELDNKVKMYSLDSIKDMNFEELAGKNEPKEYGKFTMLKENEKIDFKKALPLIINPNDEKFKQFIGNPRWKFYQYLQKEYGNEYNFPGLEYEQYLFSLPTKKVPREFKNTPTYIFIGSTFRSKDGSVRMPSALYWNTYRNDEVFARNLKVLLSSGENSGAFDPNLESDERVVLLEK